MDTNMKAALDGLKVIEIGHVVAGPFCGTMMADFGAEVIKIEAPGTGDSLRHMGKVPGLSFSIVGRNKKFITLNLKTEKGKKMFTSLLEDADILIENFRPGVLARLGFDWKKLQEINERLILVSISGFGQTGPYRDRPGFDSMGMAMGGLTNMTGFPDGPPIRPGFIISDYMTGLFGVIGAMNAVYARDVQGTNRGQIVDACLYESIFRCTESMAPEYSYNGTIKNRYGNSHPSSIPSGNFQTKDDKWMVISVGNTRLFKRFVKCIGREDLIDHPDFNTHPQRLKNRKYIDEITIDFVKNHTLEEVLDIFGNHVPCAPIYTIEDIVKDPQYQFRESIVEVKDEKFGDIMMSNVVPKLSETPGKIKWTGGGVGSNNDEIYEKKLGLTKEEIKQLKKENVI